MTDSGQLRQDRLDQHAGVPLAALARFEIGRMPVFLVKADVAENDHQVSDAIDKPRKAEPA